MENMTVRTALYVGLLGAFSAGAAESEISKYDENMIVAGISATNGVVWIDGRRLPIEGRAFDDTAAYYERLPAGVTTNVNAGVRGMKCHTSGLMFRFATDSKRLRFRWVNTSSTLAMDHMPSTGMSGIDIYRYDAASQAWRYVRTGRITDGVKGSSVEVPWTPGTPCLVNLPLYNGIREFSLGVDEGSTVTRLPPRASGVEKPVVFYGTSITHGGCASRPGLSFVNIVGRELDVPIVNLGFSGSGKCELEMSEHLAAIDASCYVIDPIWNMSVQLVQARYEAFVRNLRAKRPDVPIVMAEWCDVFHHPNDGRDTFIRALFERLVGEEKWQKLYYLPKTNMYLGDGEGTVDGVHPNDLGMRQMADAFKGAVAQALGLPGGRGCIAPVTDAAAVRDWFLDNVYGRRPAAAEKPDVAFAPLGEDVVMMDGAALRKRVQVTVKGPCGTLSFPVTAFIPTAAKGPVPAFVLVCNRRPERNIDAERASKSPFWPAEEIVARGFAAVAFYNGDVAPDFNTGNTQGVFAIYEKPGDRPLNAWGTISAWAWGASRVMDWIATEPKIDARRVAVVGHSRGGKTALLAGVTDPRFALACANDSGCSGAKLNALNLPDSEQISYITSRFPYWFCANYACYANKDRQMPHDQDEFLALMAPRLLAVASATEDDWAGQKGEFEAARRAGMTWRAQGLAGLVGDAFPAAETPLQEGSVSYHLRTGRHDLTPYDWKCYMDFAEKKGWLK